MRPSNLNFTGLVAGFLFMGLAGVFLLDHAGVWTVHPLVIGPILLIGLGVAIIAGSLARRLG